MVNSMNIYILDEDNVWRVPKDFKWVETLKMSKFCIIAEDKGKIIGFSGVKRGPLNISYTRVAEEYRNMGLGRFLLGNKIIVAKRKNYAFLTSIVGWDTVDNIPIRRITEKLGFRQVSNIGKRRTVIMVLTKAVTGNLAFAFARLLLTLFPKKLSMKAIEWISTTDMTKL